MGKKHEKCGFLAVAGDNSSSRAVCVAYVAVGRCRAVKPGAARSLSFYSAKTRRSTGGATLREGSLVCLLRGVRYVAAAPLRLTGERQLASIVRAQQKLHIFGAKIAKKTEEKTLKRRRPRQASKIVGYRFVR